jgi:hypothetical protein
VPALVFSSSGCRWSPAGFFPGSPSRLFHSPRPGAKKLRAGNFETRPAQKSERHGIQGGRLTTLFSKEFEWDFSIVNYVARLALIVSAHRQTPASHGPSMAARRACHRWVAHLTRPG